ncbi:MAG: SDR family oxidoreductase [Rhodobacteraceae bacterium]|nr:SDR family oxidoreductase [Paracoccaceae bacterium]
MDINDKIIVVTGAGDGIGKALAERFAAEGAAHVVVSDINAEAAQAVAAAIGGTAIPADVGKEADIQALIEQTEDQIGPIDLFCSNAGILRAGGLDTPDEQWQQIWDVNVMSQLWAARHLVPRMAARGGGYLLNTASAAGLLNQIGAAPYGVTKHASVGLAEWIAMSHGDEGIKVSLLCPQAVRTEMVRGHEDGVAAMDGLLEPSDVAQAVVDGLAAEQFLILPHPQVGEYIKLKAGDYDRWLGGMRKLNRVYGRI